MQADHDLLISRMDLLEADNASIKADTIFLKDSEAKREAVDEEQL